MSSVLDMSSFRCDSASALGMVRALAISFELGFICINHREASVFTRCLAFCPYLSRYQICADVKSTLNLTATVDTRLSLKKLDGLQGTPLFPEA